MELTEQELIEIVRDGGKIVSKAVAAIAKEADKPTEMAQMVAEVRALTEAMTKLGEREAVESPSVEVAAPQVTVKPQINIHSARAWDVEVTERDANRSIKKVRFTAIE